MIHAHPRTANPSVIFSVTVFAPRFMQHIAHARRVFKELHPHAQAKSSAIKNYPKQLNITASYMSSRTKTNHTTQAVI
jgi:hypothetical protein